MSMLYLVHTMSLRLLAIQPEKRPVIMHLILLGLFNVLSYLELIYVIQELAVPVTMPLLWLFAIKLLT